MSEQVVEFVAVVLIHHSWMLFDKHGGLAFSA